MKYYARPFLLGLILFSLIWFVPDTRAQVAGVTLLPADGTVGDGFGKTVSVEGGWAVVGAPLADGDEIDIGAVYVFALNKEEQWVEQAKLTPSDGAAGDEFGTAVSIHGSIVLVGAPLADGDEIDIGAVYVFALNKKEQWVEQAKLTPSDGAAGDEFGTAVSIHGSIALVGAPLADDNGTNSGAAYVYGWDEEQLQWEEQTKLVPSNGGSFDRFGQDVSIYADHALIGAPEDDETGQDAGAAYIFAADELLWTERAKVLPLDGAVGDKFGTAVSTNESWAFVGAPMHDEKAPNAGAAYIFALEGHSESSQGEKVTICHRPPGNPQNEHTISVGSGAVDAHLAHGDVLGPCGNDDSVWVAHGKLIPSDGKTNDKFGMFISVDESHATVGVPEVDDKGSSSGTAYLFTWNEEEDQWGFHTKMMPSSLTKGDQYGAAVAVSGNWVLACAPQSDHNGSDSGGAYAFDLSKPFLRFEPPMLAFGGVLLNRQDELRPRVSNGSFTSELVTV